LHVFWRPNAAIPLTLTLSPGRNDAVGKFVPPHPNPLPRGEGARLAELNRTHRLVSECDMIKDTFGSALNDAVPGTGALRAESFRPRRGNICVRFRKMTEP